MSRKPIVAAGGLLLLAAGFALAHQDLPPLVPPIGGVSPTTTPPLAGSSGPVVPPIGGSAIPSPPPAPPKPPAEKTLDELMDEVEKIRTQKAELEKKEQELVKAIQKKTTEQNARMVKLGIPQIMPAMPPIPIVPIGGTTPK